MTVSVVGPLWSRMPSYWRSHRSCRSLYLPHGNINCWRYRILDPVVRPFTGAIDIDFILIQDNVRPHRGRSSCYGLSVSGWNTGDRHGMASTITRPQSQTFVGILCRLVHVWRNSPHTVQDLTQAHVEEWQEISQCKIHRVIRSIPHFNLGNVFKLEEVTPVADNSGSSPEAVLPTFGEWSTE